MNESHPSWSAGGQQRSGLRTDAKPPQTSPLHTSANQERKGKEQKRLEWLREKKITLNRSSADSDSKTGWSLATGGKDHIQKHMYTQSEIPESSRARTITHCPPPPTQGRTSQRPKWVGQFRPRTTTRTPIPLLRIHLPPCFFLHLFSSALSPSLSVAFCLFIFLS